MHRGPALASRAIKRRSLSTTSTKEFASVLSVDGAHGDGFDVFDVSERQDGDPLPLIGFSTSRRFSTAPRPAPRAMPAPVLYDGPSKGVPARPMSTATRHPTSLGPVMTFDGPSRLRSIAARGATPASSSTPRTAPSQTLLPDWAKAQLARLGEDGHLNPED
ncbi:hypothetical protein K488DRAFT_73081 [Vararia minispora EC-137]|uniref:Uncharacterized protein n=1 Tax=Vararia minispora EC-137 TaxID=1314806 RepID=A0ACB8QC22_9AGAM|nr:hypothetical protein K488DRAFT_73081 [Vararia minispora EC-137]